MKWIPSYIIIIVITWFFSCIILENSPHQWLAALSSHYQPSRADNDSLRLLIIDVGLLIKYNALKNHVIVIIFVCKFIKVQLLIFISSLICMKILFIDGYFLFFVKYDKHKDNLLVWQWMSGAQLLQASLSVLLGHVQQVRGPEGIKQT